LQPTLPTPSAARRAVRVKCTLVALAATLTWFAASSFTQEDTPPNNNLPDPYHDIAPWGKLPEGRKWGAVNSVGIDKDGRSIWVAERCGPKPGAAFGADSCAGSDLPSILKFDASGNLVKSFGAGMLIFPHCLYVDRDGNVWVCDARSATPKELEQFPAEKNKGRQILKFSTEGKLLMTLGKAGVEGNPPDALDEPESVVTAPNGDIFVADGNHSGQSTPTPGTAARVVKFSKDGKFIKSWGMLGSAAGEFKTPHSIAMDSQGRLFVADRGNFRIQIFDQDGKLLGAWKQFGRPSGVFIDKNDMIYVADSESNAVADHPGWERGIRIGSVKDGKVLFYIPDPVKGKTQGTSAAEGVAVDAQGNVFGAEVGPRQIVKHAK
jgi:sugar lactone lactonase YvrE